MRNAIQAAGSTFVRFAALVALTVVVYANSFTGGFPLDNKALILDDARVHAVTVANLRDIVSHTYWWPRGESGLYRPLTTASYLLNYAVLGNATQPAGYHLVNVALHACNVLFVYALVRRLRSREGEAMAIAALWAVLPLSTEAVTNIVGRADLLAAFGVLGGLLAYDAHRPVLLALAAAVGLFSKETAVILPGLIVVYEWTRWRPAQSARRLANASVALAIPFAIWMLQRSSVLNAAGTAEFPFVDNPLITRQGWDRVPTALAVMGRYLWLVVWPARLSADHSYAEVPIASGTLVDWLAWLTVLLVTIVGVVLIARGRKPLVFFAALAAFALLPASNLLFPIGTIMADRVMYLPSVGVIALIVAALIPLRWSPWVSSIVVTLAVAGFATRTLQRNRDWQDDLTLWTATERDGPTSYKAHLALAEALYASDPTRRNIGRVIEEAEHSVAILASVPDALNSFHAFRQAGAYYLDQRAGSAGADRAIGYIVRALAIERASRTGAAHASTASEADAFRLLSAAFRMKAAALFEVNDVDAAAVTLMVGSMVTADPGFSAELIRFYESGFDTDRCAVVRSGADVAFNPRCPIVHRNVCAALPEATRVLQSAGRADRAEPLTREAANLACVDKR